MPRVYSLRTHPSRIDLTSWSFDIYGFAFKINIYPREGRIEEERFAFAE